MRRHLLLLLSLAVLVCLGRIAYLSGRHATTPQYKALALAKELRTSFKPEGNNVTTIDPKYMAERWQ